MATLSDSQITSLTAKIQSSDPLSDKERAALSTLVECMSATIRALNHQLETYEWKDAWSRDRDRAAAAARSTALSALRTIAPPTATVDPDAAMSQIEQYREEIDAASNTAQLIAAGARFAVRFVGTFV
ncbi:MAG: hypothetical protein KAS72_11750 [Phycisphaerales bacterium]|nr:hypothetical protein [Phycisphaerales bacterium]